MVDGDVMGSKGMGGKVVMVSCMMLDALILAGNLALAYKQGTEGERARRDRCLRTFPS